MKYSGILPRIALFIWKEIERVRKHFGREIIIDVSALEIYCEHIRDLLWEPQTKSEENKHKFVEIKTVGSKVTCVG